MKLRATTEMKVGARWWGVLVKMKVRARVPCQAECQAECQGAGFGAPRGSGCRP